MREPAEVFERKQAVRERVWRLLLDGGAARFPGACGTHPELRGAEASAERLAASAAWQVASVVKVNPDRPQLPLRARNTSTRRDWRGSLCCGILRAIPSPTDGPI